MPTRFFPALQRTLLACILLLVFAGSLVHAADDKEDARDNDSSSQTEPPKETADDTDGETAGETNADPAKDSNGDSDSGEDKDKADKQDSATEEPAAGEQQAADTDANADTNAQSPQADGAGEETDTPDTQTPATTSGQAGQTNLDGKDQAESQIANSMANIELIQSTLESLRKEIENSKESANLNRTSVQTIKEGLELIESKLKEAYSGLDESRNGIAANTANIAKLKQEIQEFSRGVRANAADLGSQKSLIEDNSIRLYEILIELTAISDRMEKLTQLVTGNKRADQPKEAQVATSSDLSRLWMLLAIVLVFFAPLAFVLSSNRQQSKPLSDGTSQQQGMVLACLGVFLGYFVLGFGLMYGSSASGWVGVSSYLLEGTAAANANGVMPPYSFSEFVLYQTGFVMLAALIVYVAVGHRFSSTAHMLLALFVGAVLVPVFGHWAWSGYFMPGNRGWLEGAGFIDQAGATTINAVAAWFALAIVWRLGLRIQDETDTSSADDPVYSSSTTQLLWLSWLGFTTGTLPISSEQIPAVMLNAGLAASAGGMAAFLHYVFFHTDKGRIARGLGGFVSGLVAIAACAQSVTFAEAAVIGASAGLFQNLAFSFLRHSVLKQGWQVQAAYLVAIHGFSGLWGTLCVALFGTDGNFSAPNLSQLVTQTQGSIMAIAYSLALGHLVMFVFFFRKKPTEQAT